MSAATHWDEVYATRETTALSWYQSRPEVSLRLVHRAAPGRGGLVDVGAGASCLADELLAEGWEDVTVLDVSHEALARVQARLGDRVGVVAADVLAWHPTRGYDVWHDRAVFHFLTAPEDQRAYVRTAATAVTPGGAVVLGAFAADGPEQCSGLPTCRYAPQDLARLFAPAFALEHHEREEHVTPAGAVQPFTWVLLRRAA